MKIFKNIFSRIKAEYCDLSELGTAQDYTPCEEITVGVFNMKKQSRKKWGAVFELLDEECDILLLQEIKRDMRFIGKAWDSYLTFTSTFITRSGHRTGTGIISQERPSEFFGISSPLKERFIRTKKSATYAYISGIHFISIHCMTSRNQLSQVKDVLSRLPKDDLPIVFCGDLNSNKLSELHAIDEAMANYGIFRATEIWHNGKLALDHVYIRGNFNVKVEVRDTKGSDHPILTFKFRR